MQAERDALAARVTELEGLTTTQTQNENHLLRVRTIPFSFSLDSLHRLFCATGLVLMVVSCVAGGSGSAQRRARGLPQPRRALRVSQ